MLVAIVAAAAWSVPDRINGASPEFVEVPHSSCISRNDRSASRKAVGMYWPYDLVPQDGLPVKLDRQTNRQMLKRGGKPGRAGADRTRRNQCRLEGRYATEKPLRPGEQDGVEQLSRYLDLMRRDTLLGTVHGILAAQLIKPQARVLARDRGINCVTVDYDLLRGLETTDDRLF